MNPFKEAFRILGFLALILIIGTTGYHIIEGWSLFDALYMTVITLATVGYGETHPLSMGGRLFTIFLIMGGMGIILYGVTEVTEFVVQGEMSGFLRRKRMNKALSKLSHHYIVCGAGKTGEHVIDELKRTRRQCVVIESNPDRVKKLEERKILVLEGDATEDATLKLAGIERAAGLVTTLPSDKENLFVVITARGLNAKVRIVTKVSDLPSREKFSRSGADSTVSTNFIGGLRMASELIRPETVSFLDTMLRDNSDLRVEDVSIQAESRYNGAPLGECDVLDTHGVLLLSLKHNGSYVFNPPSHTKIQTGDTFIVMGTPEQIQTARKALNRA